MQVARTCLSPLLNDPIVAFRPALAALVALVDGEADVQPEVAVLGVREVGGIGRVQRGTARLGRRQAASRVALAADHGVVGDHNTTGRLKTVCGLGKVSRTNRFRMIVEIMKL